jgi:hypothetical protein
MRRHPPVLAALALLAFACHSTPTATPEQRAAMGPQIVAIFKKKPIDTDVKVEITGAQSEHLKVVGYYLGDPTVERMAFRGTFVNICRNGFVDIDLSDGVGWRKVWKC